MISATITMNSLSNYFYNAGYSRSKVALSIKQLDENSKFYITLQTLI